MKGEAIFKDKEGTVVVEYDMKEIPNLSTLMDNISARSDEDFVEVEVKVQVPKTLYTSLEHLSKFVGDINVKGILTNDLEAVIRDFYDGGFYEAWTYRAMEKHDC